MNEHTKLTKIWIFESNYIVILETSEEDLYKLIEKASRHGIKHAYFCEPDLDNQITAVVLEPGNKSKKLCSNFPLALKSCS